MEDKFIEEYCDILNYFKKERDLLEKKINILGILASKKDKERLKKIDNIYYQKLSFYEKLIEYNY